VESENDQGDSTMREKIIDFLKRELIGPDPVYPFIQDNGEEVLFELPRQRYGAGILFPKQVSKDQAVEVSEEEQSSQEDDEEKVVTDEAVEREEYKHKYNNSGEELYEGDIINLANEYLPSAIGLSCFVEIPENGLTIEVKAGRYRMDKFTWKENGKVKERERAYLRENIYWKKDIKKDEIPDLLKKKGEFKVEVNEKETGLVVKVVNRKTEGNKNLLTFTLVNEIKTKNKKSLYHSEHCFFQVEMHVSSTNGEASFFPYPERKYLRNEDDEINALLYRDYHSYAIGHGCAAGWEEVSVGKAKSVRTEIIPQFEMKPILPAEFKEIELKMYDFGRDLEHAIKNLKHLCSKYEEWIKKQEEKISLLETDDFEETERLKQVAKKQVKNCKMCLERMREGLRLLEEDEVVQHAFKLMNEAMLLQQLHYSLPLRRWPEEDTDKIKEYREIKPEDKTTWPNGKLGNWRPFQIAFILMNLKAVADPHSKDRELVDIIWFPTGGGKTEAYLGLTAFTIFLRRLRNPKDSGTTVLMRYTLRLLTAQQFQRAAALITACEYLRQLEQKDLGEEPITIGLWVGSNLTPNTRSIAKSKLGGLKKYKTDDNPFVVTKCPWCGAQMGPVKRKNKGEHKFEIKGYHPEDGTVIFQCDDEKCKFNKKNNRKLPLLVIDEDIFETPPTLVVSTVDKFAIIPWKKESRALFGFRNNGERVSGPELIIQDELHLISGPLGSLAGHYETLVEALCKDPVTGRGPKIIASTATISRAKEQVRALYNRKTSEVVQFPPQCMDAGESFFAYVDRKSEQMPGRIYIGVHASALPSHATAQVRVISALSQAVKMIDVQEEKERDPYWTIVNYFNSIRELGHAATLVSADIDEYIRAMWKRKNITSDQKERKRKLKRIIELTSRIGSGEIPRYLQELENEYTGKNEDYPVDVCLATNMISVGLDISRLGLMTVIGQPKTTSEYIQATSRVGRNAGAPGLVVVLYNTSKPRDRSIYERFYSYHNKIYSHVEPVSVTPFASPVRDRALHAVMTGLVRYLGGEGYLDDPEVPDENIKKLVSEIISERVKNIDPEEEQDTLKKLNMRFEEWERFSPLVYGSPSGQYSNPPLLYPAGIYNKEDDQINKSWPTLTSMRNVDVECMASVISNYPEEEDEN
jgi:Helicase conserved C-terminal domain